MTEIGSDSAHYVGVMPDGTEVTLAWAARSETGHHRDTNQDSFVARPPIFAVADGMGGHAAGDFASGVVVTRLAEHGGKTHVGTPDLELSLRLAVRDMSRGLGVTDEGSGTTVTGIALGHMSGEAVWFVFNIGDSRVYCLNGENFEQLTMDHSIVQEMVNAGQITREQADEHPHANVITRAVGFHETPVPDYRPIALDAGMRLVICSDGLTKELTDYGIGHILAENDTPASAVKHLVREALRNGGRDNVTVMVVDVLQVVCPGGDGS
ncbi:MAG: protein phosphatase [Candidatus Lumbricidophila eiseniae]|uniref:Protein phosphatase n=1 Tax=Candidatus Lumbricidiphila eiseniae TaxID=1969409 RepID=A0A2A6FPC5_9MICO|nr:MAG: protein phosphatase [Candidatus Lumbricidophila eiseniae]